MIVDVERHGAFTLDEGFLDGYRERAVPWGFGALSWATYKRTYSRDGEAWWQTCRRVVEGTYTVLRCHLLSRGLAWDEGAARAEAREAYDGLFHFRWMPPGRGLWIMGTPFLYERGGAALNNCGFVSTADLEHEPGDPYRWMMEMSMLGVGVGFDTRGAGRLAVVAARHGDAPHLVEDSREGWARAVGRLVDAFCGRGSLPAHWDTSRLRPRGAPLSGFGGRASGPEPLREMLAALTRLYRAYEGRRVDAPLIVDTMNLVGRGAVAGGVRRSAQIAFGEPDDVAFLDLKQDPEAARSHRWVSNNSVLARVGMDYGEVARRTATNGEPGYLWIDNARAHGRLADPPDHRDEGALGSNPCVEQTLWDRELCTLVETYPARADDYASFERTLELAFRYAKTVTLVPTGRPRTDAVMAAHRRIGCSMTGIVQAVERHGLSTFVSWCERGYRYLRALDERLSRAWDVPRSIKITSVKPSGTVSLLAGATPGVHWEHAPHYMRRIRVRDDHPLVAMCERAGYRVEPDAVSRGTKVIAFPVHVPHAGRSKHEVPLREKLELAALLQRHWSDNQVSCTAEFDPATEGPRIAELLVEFETRLKGVSFLPRSEHGYEQPPYEAISKERYEELTARLGPLRGELEHEHELEQRSCEGPLCEFGTEG